MLTTGARFGSYEILEKLGEGGMGLVYRASDTTLGREVALKILPASVTADPERLARFDREARTLASLNHPHIAQIYGIEVLPTSTGAHQRALVMELPTAYDVSPDGSRFLMTEHLDPPRQPVTQLRVVFNWFEELRRAQSLSR